MKDRRRSCELCNDHATLYCTSDSAFLCFNCDSRVHGANFLVARHLRHLLCSRCNSLAAHPISGGHAVNITNYTLCSSCSPENDDDENYDTLSISDSAYSLACVSSTESSATMTKQQRSESSSVTRLSGRATSSSFAKKKKVAAGDARFEGTFVNWCEKMGMSGGNSAAVSAAASHALGFCFGRLAGVPLRVSLAASFWLGVRMTSSTLGSTCQNLRRVEMMTGVPARMILAVAAKLRRELMMRVRRGARPAELEEGWAEC